MKEKNGSIKKTGPSSKAWGKKQQLESPKLVISRSFKETSSKPTGLFKGNASYRREDGDPRKGKADSGSLG